MTPTITSSFSYRTQSRFERVPLFGRTLLPALLLLLALTARGQTTRFVSTTGTNTNPASATSWATSTTNLQGAIDVGAGEVWVSAGVYKPGGNANTNRSISFAMKNGVAIYGGFVGTETNLTQRPAINPVSGSPSSSTLSGEIGDPASTTDNSLHVFYHPDGSNLNNTALLDGFVITGGRADASSGDNARGGGIFFWSCPSVRIANCLFERNATGTGNSNTGGGIDATFSTLELTNCLFKNNSSPAGAGIGQNGVGSSITLVGCSFQNNSGVQGAALWGNGNSINAFNTSFVSNSVTQIGGAFVLYGSVLNLANCSFQGNRANIVGGAIALNNVSGTGSIHLANCVLFDNGGSNTLGGAPYSASYSLFDATVTDYTSVTGNLTTTTSPFVSTASVALNACAPAINAGDPSSATAATGPFSVTALPQTDLVGNPRIFGGRVDMGAVEFQGPGLGFTVSVTASPSLTITAGNTVTLTASGGNSYTWTGGATGSSFTATPGVGSTAYSVTGVNASGCTSTTSVTVTVAAPPPIAGFAPTATTVCANNVTTFTATLNGISGTYNFTLTNGSSPVSGTANANPFSQTLTAAGSGQQTYTLTIAANSTTATASTTVNVGNHPDYAALVDLYNSTNGASWTNKTGWLTNCDPCTGNGGNPWFGLVCSGGRVTSVSLVSNNLVGSLPGSLSALTALQMLNLAVNQLSGSIPSSLSVLTALQTLNLGGNQLSGSIPGNLSALTSLQTLVLSINQLSGSIPGSLSVLTALREINLRTNQLSGSIPNSLSALTNLQTLSLYSNQLSGSIPGNLSSLTALQTLYLHSNQLSGSIPGNLSALTNLQSLLLHNNQLSGSIPSSLSSLTALQSLALNNNQLSGCFPASLTFMCGKTTNFSSNTALPGGGSVAAFTAFCNTGAGSDAFVASATRSLSVVCVGGVVSLSTAGGGDYSWAAPVGAVLGSPATASVVSATLTSPGEKTFTVTISFGGSCTHTATVSVTASNAAPTLTVSPGSGTLTCAQTSLTLTASGNATRYAWTSGTTGASLTLNTAGTYSVTATADNGCTSISAVTIDQSRDIPTASLLASGTLTCAVRTVTLTASASPVGSYTYVFSGPGVVASSGSSATVNAEGGYSVTVTNTATGCFSQTSVTVQSNTATPSVSIAPSSGTLTCGLTSVTLAANTSAPLRRWSDNSTEPTLVVSASGTYGLSVTATNGCTASATSVTISQNSTDAPTLSLNASTTGLSCSSPSARLTASSGFSSFTFAGPGLSQTGPSPTATASQTGLYSVTATAGVCSATASVSLVGVIGTPPSVLLVGTGDLSCTTPTLTLTAIGGSRYVFSGPGIVSQTDGRQRIIVGDYVIFTTPIPTQGTAVVSKPGLYTVVVTSEGGCTSTASILVTGTECR